MWKKVTVVFLAIAMIMVFTACGSDEAAEESGFGTSVESAGPVAGGWDIAVNDAAALPGDVQTAFDKAIEKHTGSELKPVAYIADQVVSGTNYMILCEAATPNEEPAVSYQMVIVYADLDGNAEITNVKDFDLTAYTSWENTEISSEEVAGGWAVPEKAAGPAIPKEAKAAFDKAVEALTGNEIEPLALLGTQAVSGTNYAFICKSTLTTEEPVTGIQIVTVYEDLDGNAEIANICTLDPADYNE